MATCMGLLESHVRTGSARGLRVVHVTPLSSASIRKDEILPVLWEQISKRKRKS